MRKTGIPLLAFVWEGTNLRMAQEAIYRTEKSGGLGLICPTQFYKTLYTKANLAPLLLDSGLPFTQGSMKYWLGFPLRKILPTLYERSRPRKIFECHADMLSLVETVRSLRQEGTTVTSELFKKGRMLHNTLVSPVLKSGNVEVKHPLVDWNVTWGHV